MLARDERAQSVGIAKFLLSMVVALVLAWIVSTITEPILSRASAAGETATATQATGWFSAAVGNLFVFFLIIGVFGIVALAVYQREVLG